MLKRILSLTFCAALGLHAQLVEKPTPTPESKAKGASKSATAAPHKAEAKPAKSDLLDRIKAPKTFRGALIHKASKAVTFLFKGTWAPAPPIKGSGTSIEWSGMAAELVDLEDVSSSKYYKYSVNLGRREGKLYARSFTWPDSKGSEVAVTDEGSVQEDQGTYTIDLEQWILVIEPKATPWVPKVARLFRFIATDFNTPNQVSNVFQINAGNFGPRTVTFAGGSYLLLQDGNFGRVYFAPFGDANLHTLRCYHRGEGWVMESPKRVEGTTLVAGGFTYYSQLWGHGLTGFGEDQTAHTTTSTRLQLGFRGDLNLEDVRNQSDPRSTFSFGLAGSSQEVKLSPEVRAEVVDRGKDLSWAISGGPFSLKRTLLRAFEGCTIQPPRLAQDEKTKPTDYWYGKVGPKVYMAKLQEWNGLSQEAGATFLAQPAQPNPKTGPLGRIYPPREKSEVSPSVSPRTSPAPQRSASGDTPNAADKPKAGRPCFENFTKEGGFFKGMTFKTWQEFPGADKATVFRNVAQAVASNDWGAVNANQDLGIITANQAVTGGQGAVAPLNIVIKQKSGGPVRVEITFTTGPGKVASADTARTEFCKLLEAAVE